MKKTILLLSLVPALMSLHATDAPKEVFAVQPRIGLGLPSYSTDFEYLNEQVSCGKFSSGSGLSFLGGIDLELPVSDPLLLNLGIFYKSTSGKFDIDRISYAYDIAGQKSVAINAENEIKTSMQFLSLRPGIKYRLSEELLSGPLFLNFGFGLNIPIGNNFTQKENIKSPSNAVYIHNGNYVQTRDLYDGNIAEVTGLVFSLCAGLENHLKLSDNLAFTQTIGCEYNLNSFVGHASWNTFEPSLALGLRYSFFPETESEVIPEVKEEPAPAPEVIAEKVPDPIIDFKFSNNPSGNFVINTGNELIATQTLLNAVFFETNSSDLPNFYQVNVANDLNYNNLDAISAQKYNLVRIAELVKNTPKARLVVTGATSGISNEPAGLELAQQRAYKVANVLDSLGVDRKKIEIKWELSPVNPSNQEYIEYIAENQRVDITLKDAFLQEYISEQKYAELTGDIEYYINMQNFRDRSIGNVAFSGLDTNVAAGRNGEQHLKFRKRIANTTSNFNIAGKIERNDRSASDNLTLDLRTIKQNVESLQTKNFKAIIRFEYNSSILSEDNKKLIRELMQSIPQNATIRILGSTDALGGEASNKALEKQRATVAENFIRSINRTCNIETGINTQKFDDSTPIGRFLNRSIILTIE